MCLLTLWVAVDDLAMESILSVTDVVHRLTSQLAPPFILEVNEQDRELWEADLTWSKQAEKFQKAQLSSKRHLTDNYVFNHLEHLSLVDKQINLLDKNTRHYLNLKRLVLTGNSIITVNGDCLPIGLQELELALNKIQSLQELDESSPPKLTHLGVSYNEITVLQLNPSKWESLLSLDISCNKVTDLQHAFSVLGKLPKLQSLFFHGNPAALCQAYPSYCCDCLPSLIFLDGELVSNISSKTKSFNFQDKSCFTNSSLSIGIKYKWDVSKLKQKEASDSQKILYSIHFVIQFMEESHYTVTVSENTTHPLSIFDDFLKNNLHGNNDMYNLILGPALIELDPCDDQSHLSNDIVVTNLSELHSILQGGIKVVCVLSQAVLKKDDLEECKPSNSRGTSPTKKKAGKVTKPQDSLEGWKIDSFKQLPLEKETHCTFQKILQNGSAVDECLGNGVVQQQDMEQWGLEHIDGEDADKSVNTQVDYHVNLSIHSK